MPRTPRSAGEPEAQVPDQEEEAEGTIEQSPGRHLRPLRRPSRRWRRQHRRREQPHGHRSAGYSSELPLFAPMALFAASDESSSSLVDQRRAAIMSVVAQITQTIERTATQIQIDNKMPK